MGDSKKKEKRHDSTRKGRPRGRSGAESKHIGSHARSAHTRESLLDQLLSDGISHNVRAAAGLVVTGNLPDEAFWKDYRAELVRSLRTFRVYGLDVKQPVFADLPSLFVPFPSTLSIDDPNGISVILRLKDKNGNPIIEREVIVKNITATPDSGLILPTLTLTLTPAAEGKVSFAVKATTAEAKRLLISLDEVTFEPITVTFSVGTPDILKSQIRLPNPPIYVDDVNGTNISILLKDKNG